MSYKIAVASSDGKRIDVSFGRTQEFYIYAVDDENHAQLLEKRKVEETASDSDKNSAETLSGGCAGGGNGCRPAAGGCGGGGGCGSAGGHPGQDAHFAKLELVLDCRCVICKEFGFQIRKILERKAIAAFDVEMDIDAALEKVISYLDRVDNHKPWTGGRN